MSIITYRQFIWCILSFYDLTLTIQVVPPISSRPFESRYGPMYEPVNQYEPLLSTLKELQDSLVNEYEGLLSSC